MRLDSLFNNNVLCFQAEDGIRDAHYGLEFRRVLFRSIGWGATATTLRKCSAGFSGRISCRQACQARADAARLNPSSKSVPYRVAWAQASLFRKTAIY